MTTYNTPLSTGGKAIGSGWAREVVCATAIVALTTTNLGLNNLINLFNVPKGAVIVDAKLGATDMDSATSLVFDVGDATTADLLITAVTTGQSAGLTAALAYTGHLYKYTAQTMLILKVHTAPGTPVAGTVTVSVMYFVDPEFVTTAMVAA